MPPSPDGGASGSSGNQSRTDQFTGCLGSANLDGTDGKCLDQGDHSYAGVRVDESAVYFVRDGEILRMVK